MGSTITRRGALKGSAALAALAIVGGGRARADDWVETHGLSSFGDLALPPDFKRLAYVNPDAPKGGLLSLQITATSGNQNFDTFDMLNIFSKRGDGAAGMSAVFDTLMSGNGDEPDSIYGLLVGAVRVSPDKLGYRFLPRPEGALRRRLQGDGGGRQVLARRAQGEGAPDLFGIGWPWSTASPPRPTTSCWCASSSSARSDAHLVVAGMPIFSAAWWKGRDFDASTLEARLGSVADRVKTFEQGRFIEFELRDDIGPRPADQRRPEQFPPAAVRLYRERQVAFEAFKAGAINTIRSSLRAYGRRATIFPP